jgi:uncharacterized protein
MSLISDLWALQEIDVALDARKGSLADAESRIGETDELLDARAHADEAQGVLRDARAAQHDIEQEADDLKAKIAPLETKLYGGSIRQPKELADLQADIDALKRHLSSVEDRDLEALVAVESAEAQARERTDALAVIESAWRDEQAELTARIGVLQGEVSEYAGRRETQAGYVSEDTLRMYDRLRAAHQGRALAKLDRNLCTGCRISLPTNVVTRARGGNAMVQCPNCERILVA